MERAIIRPARIVEGKVEIQQGDAWQSATDVTPLSQGESDSVGFSVIGDQVSVYIVNTQPDLKATIDKLVAVCDQIVAIGNNQYIIGATGAVFGSPLQSVATSANEIKQELEALELK